MTNTTEATFLVTACPDHGTKECSDFTSAVVYIDAALWCERNHLGHDETHAVDGTDCWVCCERMVIDPHGMLD